MEIVNKQTDGHRDRLKEKFIKTKFSNWQEYEILEFTLTFALGRKDTKQLAKNLLTKYKTLKNLLQADYDDLIKVDGIGKHTAIFLMFLKQFSIKYSEFKLQDLDKISSPYDVVDYLKAKIGTSCDEKFYAILLNASNKILKIEEISKGDVNRSAVYPRKIVELSVLNKATGVIVAHNHPGGTTKPSQNDIIATDIVIKSLKLIDVVLLDHIIITSSDYYSFKDNGLI